MGDEERAYYDRLNAYKSDRQPRLAADAPMELPAELAVTGKVRAAQERERTSWILACAPMSQTPWWEEASNQLDSRG